MDPENDVHCSESAVSLCVMACLQPVKLRSAEIGIVMSIMSRSCVCRDSSRRLLGLFKMLLQAPFSQVVLVK